MTLTLTVVICCVAVLGLLIFVRIKRSKDRTDLEQHSITAAELHSMLASNQDVLLFDVRQPLDVLAYPEIIPSARRIPPNEVLENPSLIPKERDAVVYCTCPSEKTSRAVLRRALGLHFLRIKFLRGGLAAWKTNGYPVEPYRESFHLYVPSLVSPSK
jgi:rhodanese-related sulfurtransferase